MNNNEVISILDNLIETCRRGQEVFRNAAESIQYSEFRRLFNIFSQQRTQFMSELQAEVHRLGGDTNKVEETTASPLPSNTVPFRSPAAKSAGMRDEALHTTLPVERFAGSGAIKNLGAIDMTRAQNLAEYERALNAEIERKRGIVAANGSYMPRWLRGGDSVDKYNDANGELQNLLGAKAELAMFRQDLRRYNDQHPAGEIVKAADHQTTAPGSKENIASGFNAAGNAAEKPEPHPPSGDVAGARQRTARPLTPG